jgi:nicotinic acid mononucleotide adenylyltransferase
MDVDPFDLASLFALRELIGAAGRMGQPQVLTVAPVHPARSVALLPGSFNPPTAAHVLLAERALSEGFDRVLFTYARNTLGKAPNGLIPEDRLLALRAGATNDGFSVGVCSHGLYADQAEAAAAIFPGAELSFLVGSDKVIQIFDHRWYRDRDAALDRLFGLARLVVAPRADQGEPLREILRAPENRRFADHVDMLRLHPAVSDLSSTRIRGLLRAGADPVGLVPQAVAGLIIALRAFMTPVTADGEEVDAYGIRARLIDVLWRVRVRDVESIDLRSLVRVATSATESGRLLRAVIARGDAGAIDLANVEAAAANG